ncbi:hypothetical protein CK203_019986 [Vitis vinifera]|uniref:Uncharacterized protein n=1 Tax=Vitis vinifera TaxID=29760 RepID=A0A438J3B1_VITVI|nr:hypothetical protein CK203_019986 [Vitis vinifera]
MCMHVHEGREKAERKGEREKERHLRRDLRNYINQIPSKVALIQDNLSVKVLRSQTTSGTEVIENKLFYSLSKLVPLLNYQDSESVEQSNISSSSFPTPANSSESSNVVKSNLMSSFIYRSQEHNSSFYDDFGSSSKQEKSGQRTHHYISGYPFYGFLPIPIPGPMHPVPIILPALSSPLNTM